MCRLATSLLLVIVFFLSFGQGNDSPYRWISATSGLRVRESPDLNGEKIGLIPYGERIEIISEQDEVLFLAGTKGKWTEIRGEEFSGWVFGGFLSHFNLSMAVGGLPNEYTDAINKFLTKKLDKTLALCRVEMDGYGYEISDLGVIAVGDGEFDINSTYCYEEGIRIVQNSGYEWGSMGFLFDTQLYSVGEIFALASSIYETKYREYLTLENEILTLPQLTESWNREYTEPYISMNFSSEVENGKFKSFRIDESVDCGEWWYFEVVDGHIRFGDGGGC